ncbi:MAG: Dihydroneopterin aldolase [Bacteroidetes bacterium ADurb.Bin408]|nr:MAG: Dihydroneopterin aldolase [Bacteroidetes bacterium ADurb.Bin408]
MAVIELKGMEFFAYHGCFSEEQIIGNRFMVDVSFECNTIKAEQTDALAGTVDYQEVYKVVKSQMEIKSKLLEHVGRRISDAIKNSFPEIRLLSVKVCKCHPPLGGKIDMVLVEIKD